MFRNRLKTYIETYSNKQKVALQTNMIAVNLKNYTQRPSSLFSCVGSGWVPVVYMFSVVILS